MSAGTTLVFGQRCVQQAHLLPLAEAAVRDSAWRPARPAADPVGAGGAFVGV